MISLQLKVLCIIHRIILIQMYLVEWDSDILLDCHHLIIQMYYLSTYIYTEFHLAFHINDTF